MKRLVILGAAESGIGAAILGKRKGFDVFVSDIGEIKDGYKSLLQKENILFEENNHSQDKILNADEVVKSPGIPEKAEIIKLVRNKNIHVISEIEFASRYTSSTIVAVTGTNGKSTTTSLIYHILKKAGLDVSLVGNIGYSFAKQVAEKDTKYYVMEISSFQLDDCYEFSPHISIILNISNNHLDRYHYSIEEYAKSKFRITQKQTIKDFFIYNYDDQLTQQLLKDASIDAVKIPFSQQRELPEGAYTKNEQIMISVNHKPFTMSIYDLGLQGKHNLYNSMAAAIAANLLDLRKDIIRESLTDFKSLEHRLEFVANIHGIEFINDSKATNVNSVWYALESMQKPVVWIAGGVDKGNDYSILEPLVKEKVKSIVCLGKDNRKIHEAFSKSVDIMFNTQNMEEAVKTAYHFAQKGDVVLLSPACASFDLFENYEDRGNKFKEVVKAL